MLPSLSGLAGHHSPWGRSGVLRPASPAVLLLAVPAAVDAQPRADTQVWLMGLATVPVGDDWRPVAARTHVHSAFLWLNLTP